MPVLLCAGKGRKGGCWAEVEAKAEESEAEKDEDNGSAPRQREGTRPAGCFAGAVCPVAIVAKEVCHRVGISSRASFFVVMM